MWKHLLRHEWRLLTSDRSLQVVIAIFIVVAGYGAANGARAVDLRRQASAEARAEEHDRIARQEATMARLLAGELTLPSFADPRNPQSAGGRLAVRYAVLPESALGSFAIGQSDLLPAYCRVTSESSATLTASAELQNPHHLLTGRFDLAFVIIYLFPLLILALTYNVLSEEKEGGTLALVLSQPLRLRTLVVVKLVVRTVAILGSIVVLALVATSLTGGSPLAAASRPALALWLLAVTAYGLFWLGLALVVVSIGRASSTNAMLLASVWLILVIVLPALLNLVVTSTYPIPSRVEMIQALREASDEANGRGSALLAAFYEDHPDLAAAGPQNTAEFNVVRLAVDAEVERRIAPVLARYEAQFEAQRNWVTRLRPLSPAVLMQAALNDISGTGTHRHARFVSQVRAYQDRWRRYFADLVVRRVHLRDYQNVPKFDYLEEPFADVRSRVLGTLAWMTTAAVALTAVGLWRAHRFPIV
jgi:ABC-2 type transport system permease protein